MTQLFQKIETLIPTLEGWATVPRCQMLAAAVMTLRPEISICLGVFAGRDTFALALAHKEIGKGKVIGIDAWYSGIAIQGETPENVAFWSHQETLDYVYKSFMDHRKTLGLEDIIEVQRMQSDYYDPPDGIGILIIDGSHSAAQAVADTKRYAPKCSVGAIVQIDDLGWVTGGPRAAEEYILTIGFKHLYTIEQTGVYQRVSK